MARKRISVAQQALQKESANRKVLYRTHSGPQTEFMTSPAEELLYGGAAGGGKSFALRAFAVNYAMSYPMSRGVLFRQSFRQLDETHLIEIQREIPQSIASYMAAKHDLVFKNGSIIHFRFCEHDEQARSYDTAEFDYMLFDELTHFSQFTYTYLTSRCRSTKPWWPGPRIRSGATPLGPGHSWVKERWRIDTENSVDPFKVWKAPVSEGGMLRQFIPARVTDNKTLFEGDPGYLDRLQALPWEEYQAKALGNWSVFTGQFFMRWRQEIHVLPPFDIPPDWERFMCVDYGDNAPYCVLWLARPPGSDMIFVYREHYGTRVRLSEQVARAAGAVADHAERIRVIVLDPSMYNRINVKGEHVDSMATDWEAEFSRHTKVRKGNNNRVSGWRLVREMLDWVEGPDGGILRAPRLRVFSNCSNLIRTLPAMVIDKHDPEDMESTGVEDHAVDALRYGLVHAFLGSSNPDRPQRTLRLGPKGLTMEPSRSKPSNYNYRADAFGIKEYF